MAPPWWAAAQEVNGGVNGVYRHMAPLTMVLLRILGGYAIVGGFVFDERVCMCGPKTPLRENADSPLDYIVTTFALVLRCCNRHRTKTGGSNGGGSSNSTSGGGSGGNSFGADEFLELDVHVRRWNFMARKGLNKLTPKFGLINVSVAFLVEGREDAEVRRPGSRWIYGGGSLVARGRRFSAPGAAHAFRAFFVRCSLLPARCDFFLPKS